MTGASWVDVEAILDYQVSDTTLRARRDEWIDAGVFDTLCAEAVTAFDRVGGLNLDDVAIDGSLHKAPYGGEGTGPTPTDRGKCGWKWSVAADGHGIPIGWTTDGANRNDLRLLQPTLDAVEAIGLHHDITMLYLNRGYDYPKTRAELAARDYTDLDIQRRGTKAPPGSPHRLTLGLCWVVEATNSWSIERLRPRDAPARLWSRSVRGRSMPRASERRRLSMQDSTFRHLVLGAISTIGKIDAAQLTDESLLVDLGLDSLDLSSILVEIEDQGGAEVPEEVLDSLVDLGELATVSDLLKGLSPWADTL